MKTIQLKCFQINKNQSNYKSKESNTIPRGTPRNYPSSSPRVKLSDTNQQVPTFIIKTSHPKLGLIPFSEPLVIKSKSITTVNFHSAVLLVGE